MLYTRKGDDGTSSLFGTKERYPKDSAVYDALGTLDELNSLLGLCRVKARAAGSEEIARELSRVQECLFMAQAEIAGAPKSIPESEVSEMERAIELCEEIAGNPHSFVVPGATDLSAHLDFARAVSRRMERTVVRVRSVHGVSPGTGAYLNRLSSLLYALARYASLLSRAQEQRPAYSLA